MATTGDDDVIENMNTSNEGAQVIELNDVPETKADSKEINGGNSHSNSDENVVSSGHAKQNSESKPLLPKIFIALLVVLVIAVIALSFVLYHLNKVVDDTDTKADGVSDRFQSLKTDIKAHVERIKNLEKEKDKMMAMITRFEKEEGEISKDLSKNITILLKRQRKYDETVTEITGTQEKQSKKLINLNITIHNADGQITYLQKDVSSLERNESVLSSDISSLLGNITQNTRILQIQVHQTGYINKTLNQHKKELRQVTEFVQQLHLYMQYNTVKDKLNFTSFKDILKLIGKEDLVDKNSTVLERLLDQVNDFGKYNKKWNIEYKDVIRLMDGDDLKDGKPLATLKKIDKLCGMFNNSGFEDTWNITFEEVIRLTTKDDMKVITLNVAGVTTGKHKYPPVLEKIRYLFQEFNRTYREKWGVQFQDIVALTVKLDFKVGDKNITVFGKISSWYVTNFTEIWGDSFAEFFAIMKDNPKERTSLLKGITDVANKERFLKFLPAKFVYKENKLSVYGYIEVFLLNIWGTVWKKRCGSENAAKVLCKQAGYDKEKGAYDKGIYNIGTVNRTSMRCLLSALTCDTGTEPNVTSCWTHKINDEVWDHKEDAGIKCTF